MKIEYRELNSNGYTLRGLFSTPDNGFKTITVLLHGFTGHMNENGFLFKQLTKTLTDINIATLRYDFMGSGISDGDFSDFTFFTEIEDARNIIKEAYELNGNKKINLLGFSMGGAVATRISLEMKDYIENLVLLAPAGMMPQSIRKRFEVRTMDKDGNIDLGGFKMNKKVDDTFEGYDMYKDIETFDKPVLIVQGSSDQAVFPEYSKRYHDLYPDSRYHMIEGAEHCFTKVEYRERLNELVREFLNK